MNIKEYLDRIGNLIGEDKLPMAIKSLSQLLKNSPKMDELIIQSARYNSIQKQIRTGIITFQDANISKNQIRFAILELIREIEIQYNENTEIRDELSNINEKDVPQIKQTHFGSGDNIGGDKIINNG